jgi:transcriptional regulator with XRE-family HTH domain
VGRPKVNNTIGNSLRKAREAKNISLEQVIAQLQILGIPCTKSTLSRIENNETSCRVDILAGLASIYNQRPDHFMYVSNNPFK